MSRDKMAVAERSGLIMIFIGSTQGVIPFPVHEISSHDAFLSIAGMVRTERAIGVRTTELSWTQKVSELCRILDVTVVTGSDVQYLDSDEMSSMAVAQYDVMSIDDFEKVRKYAGSNIGPEYGSTLDAPADEDFDAMAGEPDE